MGDIIQIRRLTLLKHKFIVWSEWGDQRPKNWDDPHFSIYDFICIGLVFVTVIIVSALIIGLLMWRFT